MSEVIKRRHRKQKTASQIKKEIEDLKVELARREQEERLKIGQKMQDCTGLETWEEIEAFLRSQSRKPETANLS